MSDFDFYVSALATKKEGSVRAQASLKFLSRALTCLILVDNISISKSLRDIPGLCELQSQEQNKPQSDHISRRQQNRPSPSHSSSISPAYSIPDTRLYLQLKAFVRRELVPPARPPGTGPYVVAALPDTRRDGESTISVSSSSSLSSVAHGERFSRSALYRAVPRDRL
ncbi:hypothetical protein OG21DRAFT_1489946 [Imleria badia]|nr:hypothetical protein OG21DRAFT_1489946 [Imleria badia]